MHQPPVDVSCNVPMLLLFHMNNTINYCHCKSLVVPCSDNDFCMSLFMTMLNDSGLLCLRAQVPKDTGTIGVHYYYYYYYIIKLSMFWISEY